MPKKMWINLPVKNVEQSVAFYTKLGFNFNTKHGKEGQSACMLVGENSFVVMLFEENIFNTFTGNKLPDNEKLSEVLFSIDAESKNEVNEFSQKVEQAGGKIYRKATENEGWIYGFGFCDLDGHRWNMIYMDEKKLNKPII